MGVRELNGLIEFVGQRLERHHHPHWHPVATVRQESRICILLNTKETQGKGEWECKARGEFGAAESESARDFDPICESKWRLTGSIATRQIIIPSPKQALVAVLVTRTCVNP